MKQPPIIKSQLHSVRLDSDVWAAVKALPDSLNRYLRRSLLEPGKIVETHDGQLIDVPRSASKRPMRVDVLYRKPLLKPSQRK